MSRLSSLAAQLRGLAAQAAAHSSPIALSQVLAEGFTLFADAITDASTAAEEAVASVQAMSEQDLADVFRGFAAGASGRLDELFTKAAPAGDQASPPAIGDQVEIVTADQIGEAAPRAMQLASTLHGLSAEEFEDAVINARAILFGQVAG